MRLHICIGTVNAPVYIRIEMRAVNKCVVGTRYLSVMLLVSLYFTIFQLIQAFFFNLILHVLVWPYCHQLCMSSLLLHCLYILLVTPTD